MKRASFYLFAFPLLMGFLCCTQETAENQKILCRINEYKLPVDDFQAQLAEELEMDHDFKLTQQAKQQFLEGLIRKELLIQEAKKRELDRKEKFVRAIERYWESTLIRDLMDLKCEEINKRTPISEEEIDARYKDMKSTDASLPARKEMYDRIKEELKEEKMTATLEVWVNDLRKNATIEINQDFL
jgi:hypothetical protein